MRAMAVSVVLVLGLIGCRPQTPWAGGYIVTAAPLDVAVVSRDLCVGVNPSDAQGVWWWEPGSSGCSSRSTGPGVFHADHAAVAAASGGPAIEVRLRVQLTRQPTSTRPDYADIRLVIENGEMRDAASGARVATTRRPDLELPELPPLR
jgi:hypothetical protein